MKLDEPGLLAIEFYSRFSRATKHKTWIKFPEQWEENEEEVERESPIEGYYCDCKSGARTVGCCGHVAAALWFLGYSRHLPVVPAPSPAPLNYVIDAPARPAQHVVAPVMNVN